MDKNEIKSRINLFNIQEKEFIITEMDTKLGIEEEIDRQDYIVDYEGNFIYPVNPLEYILINYVKDLEARINKIEEVSR